MKFKFIMLISSLLTTFAAPSFASPSKATRLLYSCNLNSSGLNLKISDTKEESSSNQKALKLVFQQPGQEDKSINIEHVELDLGDSKKADSNILEVKAYHEVIPEDIISAFPVMIALVFSKGEAGERVLSHFELLATDESLASFVGYHSCQR